MVHGGRLQRLLRHGLRQAPTLDQHHGVQFLVDQLLCFTQQFSRQHHHTRSDVCRVVSPSGSITHLLVLNFGEITHDLSSSIVNGHRLENGGSIVGDEERTGCGSDLCLRMRRMKYILNNFVHSLRTESGLDEIGNGSGSNE